MAINRVPEPSDGELMERARQGEREAFAAIYRRHQAVVHRFARSMTGSPEVADDVVQDVFLTLMRDLGRYDSSRAALSTYLYGVARNLVRHRLRRERRWVELDAASERVASGDVGAQMVESERVRQVRAGIASLSVRHREVLVLCDLHEVSYIDAAVALKVPVGTVRSRLHRARQQLLERLRRCDARAVMPSRSTCLT
ncbi:MAG: RNA polymerase sigma factor [Vicinamibacterales bacterium]